LLRLETLMQVWWDATHSPALFAAYQSLGGLPPNESHHLLATRTGVGLVTLNMDPCVEDAAREMGVSPPHVTHLHGVWDDLTSIKTTIEAYEQGLAANLLDSLKDYYLDRSVLVLGYSGRDNDVLPRFLDYRPKALFWVHYDPDKALSPEAVTFLEDAHHRGMNVRVLTGDSAPYLRSMPGTLPRRSPTKHPVVTGPDLLDAQLAAVPHTPRVLALASSLADLGMWNDAIELLHGVGAADPLAPNAAKLAGRFQRQAGHPQLALREFGWPPTTPAKMRLAASCSNELLAAGLEARRSSFLAANGLLAVIPDALAPAGRSRKTVRASRSRFAQYLSMRGLGVVAEPLARRALSPPTTPTFGMRAFETVYLSDVVKAQGRYLEAMGLLNGVARWYYYLGVHGQTDFRWRFGEVLFLTGDLDAAQEHLRWVAEASLISGSEEQAAWHLTTFVAAFGATDPPFTESVADRLRRTQDVTPAARCYARFGLAEWSLLHGDTDSCNANIAEAESVIRSAGRLWRLPTYALTAQYFRGRLLARDDPDRGAALLAKARRGFWRWRMSSMQARCEILRLRALGLAVPRSLVDAVRSRSWHAEQTLLQHPESTDMLPIVL
jgi:hypothetical protein